MTDSPPAPAAVAPARRHRSWQESVKLLIKFKEATGHARVPRKHDPDPSLGFWVMRQRASFHKGTLSEERRSQLETLGFDFGRNDPTRVKWAIKLEVLKAWKASKASPSFNPRYSEVFQGHNLGQWVYNQRRKYNNASKKLSKESKERHQLLESVGVFFGEKPNVSMLENSDTGETLQYDATKQDETACMAVHDASVKKSAEQGPTEPHEHHLPVVKEPPDVTMTEPVDEYQSSSKAKDAMFQKAADAPSETREDNIVTKDALTNKVDKMIVHAVSEIVKSTILTKGASTFPPWSWRKHMEEMHQTATDSSKSSSGSGRTCVSDRSDDSGDCSTTTTTTTSSSSSSSCSGYSNNSPVASNKENASTIVGTKEPLCSRLDNNIPVIRVEGPPIEYYHSDPLDYMYI